MESSLITYQLSKPVEHAGQTYQNLSFRVPETGDLIAAEQFKGQISQTVAMLAMMSDVPLPAFKRVPLRELYQIMELTKDFLGNALATTGD
ncbi:phage tail assembly protein [Rhizobium leguminosarum bv. viciae]|nr:phage tail assembly protein [Rhizobium leguminosarum bv. viciae]